jgi:uncharacterized protein (TIGR02284 family)
MMKNHKKIINVREQTDPNFVDTNNTNVVINLLNDLITTNRGMIDVYQTAVEQLDNNVNATLLQNYVDKHKTFVLDLSNMVVRYGGDPATGSTSSTLVKQAWVTLKATLTEGDGPILVVVAKDAETVMEAYVEAMGMDLPDDVRDVIREHLSESRLNYEKLSALSKVYNND